MKKRICVINTVTWLRAPISNWLNDNLDTTLISSYQVDKSLLKDINQFIYFEKYNDDEELENLVIKLHQQEKFDLLIALSEKDILRVAKLRELLGIQGQNYFSALLYRDKYIMKQFAKIIGLNVPEFSTFSEPCELMEKVSKIGFPILIKPLSKSGSEGVQVLKNKEEYDDYLEKKSLWGENYDVEQFILGDMYHVDGIVENNELKFVSVSKYWNSLGKSTTLMESTQNTTITFADFTINKSDWEFLLLKGETKKFVEKSNFNNGTIHAEFIISEKDKTPYFIEIASRTGGLMISDTIEKKYGIIMNEVSFYLQVGQKVTYPLKNEPENFGFLTVFPQNKKLIEYDVSKIKQDLNVIDFYENHKIGKHYKSTEYMNHIGIILFKGTSQENMKQKIQYLTRLIDSNIKWE
ncbi:Nikkomycin biosynthesis protein, carboxylase [Streptococcus infantarius subsp. infantarius]|uniref:ATP-grasp domain-containing protein n=1 Tax=Streptococcus TaxID=1301 RepID=UPI00202A4696|nr:MULTISPECIES: ATP-grasp domain-containing protein [Streptococcus]MCO4465783.1 Nikkomycin biosynthesis protein, carboxylase [Streptococcus infantarius subsp. infantarius]MCO4484677.1 Nikkomycin biosynthesis protein, carboxylase [Streptococcus infantarius subsp. infantarius]MCO4500582.1 Nikkomycin biosynthesis protein, carboxylase [Streptococcus infantarius subsp. infantarius]MCO4504902.1 Nikkomycin biosynthesis protein, carboxylase [Streptococcus infantarius subsp. infantarius]MCO4518269.1 N